MAGGDEWYTRTKDGRPGNKYWHASRNPPFQPQRWGTCLQLWLPYRLRRPGMDAYVDELRQSVGSQIPFVGRQSELTAFDSLMASARRPVVLEVAGEPGIGKTRLLAEFAAIAERCGATVAAGRATEYERALPFGLFKDALD